MAAPAHKTRKDYTGKTNLTVTKVAFIRKRRPANVAGGIFRKHSDQNMRRDYNGNG